MAIDMQQVSTVSCVVLVFTAKAAQEKNKNSISLDGALLIFPASTLCVNQR